MQRVKKNDFEENVFDILKGSQKFKNSLVGTMGMSYRNRISLRKTHSIFFFKICTCSLYKNCFWRPNLKLTHDLFKFREHNHFFLKIIHLNSNYELTLCFLWIVRLKLHFPMKSQVELNPDWLWSYGNLATK